MQKFGFQLFYWARLTLLLLTAFLAAESRAQTTITNRTVLLSANELRDRLYDASTSSPLLQNPTQAAVLHLMDLATRLNPGVLSGPNALLVMQNVIAGMTNALGSQPQMTMMDLSSVALPYFQAEFSKVLSATTVSNIQNGLAIYVVAELQGQYSTDYSNITTALPAGSVFSGLENTASAILVLQRQSASEVATLALPERIRTATDGAFRQAAAQLVAQITGITPDDSLTTLMQRVPALQNSAFLRNLVQTAANTGQVTTDINSLIGEATNALNSLSLSTSNNITVLARLAVLQQNILGSQSSPAMLSNSLVLAQQIQSNYISSISIAQPTVNFLSTVITDFGGDPQLGQQVATVGSAAFKVAGAINQFAGNKDVSNGILSLSSTIATGNLLGAVLGVFSLFGDSGPSPDQIILQQIQVLQQNIAQLSAQINTDFTQLDAQLNSRFDQVDSELTNILTQINNNMITINTDFSYVDNNLGQIRSSLLDLQGDLQRLESQTYTWLTAIDQENLNLLLHNSLGYEDNVGLQMAYVNGGSEGDFVSFEGQYWLWATQNSVNGLYQPKSASFNIADLYSQFATDPAPEAHLSYVNQFIAQNLGLVQPFSGDLANPRVWSIAANGLAEMCVENPVYFRRYNIVNDLGSIIQLGNNLNTFLNNLVAFNPNKPNTNLWIAACNGYRNAVSDFTNAILNDFSLFAINNNFPTGFNPFTNQFLSLVAPAGGTIKDGYYPNASVAGVTAMACSPTPDGMPVYFLDQNTLRMLDTNGIITTLAGTMTAGFSNGSPGLLNNPRGLAVASNGSVYISDTGNGRIRVFKNGLLTTLINTYYDTPSPQGMLLDRQGSLLVADPVLHGIYKVIPDAFEVDASIITFAGTPEQLGTSNGLIPAVEANGPAYFSSPTCIAVDKNGHVYVADSNNNLIRQIVTAGASSVVYTFAGQLTSGLLDGTGQNAQFNLPRGIASDATGNLYLADADNNAIRKITPAGVVTTVAGGSGPGSSDGIGAAAQFDHPVEVAVDGAGNLYVADLRNSTIRKMSLIGTNWVVSTLAGKAGVLGAANGFGTNATFYWPTGLALDSATNLYVGDFGNSVIRKITPAGAVSYFAGSPGVYGTNDGVGTNAQFDYPECIAVDGANNIYVADTGSDTIRRISPSGVVTTFAGSAGQAGTNDASGSNARFNQPTGVAVDGAGNIYVADQQNNTVRKISPDGAVSTIAGVPDTPYGGYSDGAIGPIAQFWTPSGLAMDTNGLIYVTDAIKRTIRTIDANGLVGTYPAYPTSPAFLLPQVLTVPASAPPSSALGGIVSEISTEKDINFYSESTVALKADGTVVAWGDNSHGQCNVPAGLGNVVTLATSLELCFALKADGTVAAWGNQSYGSCNVPAGLGNVVAIAAGEQSGLALKADGTVAEWGYNPGGYLNVPASLDNVVAIAAESYNNVALKADSTVVSWGEEGAASGVLSNVVAVAAASGSGYFVALKADGTVEGWGANDEGQATPPTWLDEVVTLAAGDLFCLALKADGSVVAWGLNGDGELINVPPETDGRTVAVAAGEEHALALMDDGTVVAWGGNSYGQCNVPAGLNNVVAVAAADAFSLALKSDGTVVAWGDNSYGQCNVPAPALSVQLNDTLVANAAVQQFSAGVITPNGRVLIADKFGLRLFDNSLRVQKQAASYLLSDMNNASGGLHTAAQNLTAWHMLLQTLATYGLPTALNNNDALNSLLFGSNPLIDSASATTYLNTLVSTPNWEPVHVDAAAGLQTVALGQIDQLQSLLLTSVTQAATNANPASLPLVTDTLNRLNLLLATHAGPIPQPALCQSLGSSNTLQVTLNGFPYVHYELETSPDLKSWSTYSTVFRQSGGTNFSTAGTRSRFFRGFQIQ